MARSPDRILDELLVLRCQGGDSEAFGQLVARWDRRLRQHAWYSTGDPEATQDIVQNAWLAIIRSIRRLKEPAAFRGWAFRIVGNKAADWARRRSRQRTVLGEAARNKPAVLECRSPIEDERSIESSVRQAIKELTADSQQILSMKYMDRMSTREIAQALNIPTGTVKSRLHRARERLRQVLKRSEQ